MNFPACTHKNQRPGIARPNVLTPLAAEPYRIFFASGALWSMIGVALWPLFYAGRLGFYPNVAHARLMIEAFGGAFVVGFLGTAGPRMASAPRLTGTELAALFSLHLAGAISHLVGRPVLGDSIFAMLLAALLGALVVRIVRFRREPPPPQLVLAATGLGCGIAGALLLTSPWTMASPERLRLAHLLLYQGLLLPPALGIGSFVFPRILGGGFGEARTPGESRARLLRALLASVLLVGSFFLETHGHPGAGLGGRLAVSAAYLLAEVRWSRAPGDTPRGSLTTGLFWSLGLGALGLALAGPFYAQHVSVEHLLYIGGFGLLILVVASRVLFGHSGDLAGFFRRSGWVRCLVFLAVLAATTRATPAWVPSTTISHHIYAAWTWGLLALGWLIWHRRRFVTRDPRD